MQSNDTSKSPTQPQTSPGEDAEKQPCSSLNENSAVCATSEGEASPTPKTEDKVSDHQGHLHEHHDHGHHHAHAHGHHSHGGRCNCSSSTFVYSPRGFQDVDFESFDVESFQEGLERLRAGAVAVE